VTTLSKNKNGGKNKKLAGLDMFKTSMNLQKTTAMSSMNISSEHDPV
jgi:hypothetical protein